MTIVILAVLLTVGTALADHDIVFSIGECDKATGKLVRQAFLYAASCGTCIEDDGGLMFSCAHTESAEYYTKDKTCADQSTKRQINLVEPECIPVNPENPEGDYMLIRTYNFGSESAHQHSAAKRSVGRPSKLDLAKMMLGLL